MLRRSFVFVILVVTICFFSLSIAHAAQPDLNGANDEDYARAWKDVFENNFLFRTATAGRNAPPREPKEKRQIDASLELQPTVIIPALMNSNLWLELHEAHPDHFYCRKNQDDYSLLWLSEEKLYIPGYIQCWLYYLNFTYNPALHLYNSAPGVKVNILNYGDSAADIEYLDPTHLKYPMWVQIIEGLTEVGYVLGKNLFTAPYDFRQGPDAFQVQYDALQLLIETASAANGNKPVVLISLSMGCPYTHLFLTSHVSQAWKDRYVSSFVSYSGVYAGSSDALLTILSGGNAGSKEPKINNEIRSLARTWGSVNWLVPPARFWDDQVFVYTPEKNYTMNDVHSLYPLFGADDSLEIYEGVNNYTTLQDPGVKVYCYYGYNTSTLFTVSYDSTDYPNASPTSMTFVDGDDTAAVQSLALCSQWSNVTVIPVENMQHAGFMYDGPTVTQLIEILTNQPLNTTRPPIPPCTTGCE